MSPPVPALGNAVMAVFRLSWMRQIRGKKLRLALISVALVLVAVVAVRYLVESADPRNVMREAVSWGYFTLLVYLVPFLFTSGSVAEEVEARTFTYLASRPVGRLAITMGKYLAGCGMAIAVLAASILLMHIAVFLTEPTPMIDALPDTLRQIGAITLLALVYGAVCMFWGAVAPEAAGIISVLYLGIVEFAASGAPLQVRLVSMNYHAQHLAGMPKAGLMPDTVPDIPVWASVIVVSAVAMGFLFLAVTVVRASEYRVGTA